MLRVHVLRPGLLVVEMAITFPAVKVVVALGVVLLQRAEALEILVTVMTEPVRVGIFYVLL
jgi:hypothetical protein